MGIDARWSDDGSRILVARTVDPRAWPLLDAARPDIGALCFLAGLLVLAVGASRILRTPRTPGRSYCRRCNHDLNAAAGVRPDPPRCPECGQALDGRGIAPGVSRGRRLARVIVPALVAVACGAALFVTSIERRPAPFGGPRPAWPVAAASALGNWPWWRRTTIENPEAFVLRIDVIRVDADGLLLESPALATGSRQWTARPDGSMIAWAEHSPRSGWHPRVEWFDTRRGRGGTADLGPPSCGFPSICGWSPDGREIIALLQRTDPHYDTREDGTAIIAVDVMAIDPGTGTVRTAGRGRGRATGGPPGGWALGPAIAAVGTDPTARTVTLAGEQVGQGNGSSRGGVSLRELTVIGDSGTRIVPLGGTLVEDVWGFRRAWVEPGGRLGVEFASTFMNVNPALQGGPQRVIDLETGAVTEPPSTPIARSDGEVAAHRTVFDHRTKTGMAGRISPDGSRQFRIEVDWSTEIKISRIRVLVDRVDR
jgi:hypothetical protein